MKINYNTAVQAGKQARAQAMLDCVEEIRSNAHLCLANDLAYNAGQIDDAMHQKIDVISFLDKKRIYDEYKNLIYPNTVFDVADQVLSQMFGNNEDWPV